MTSPDAGHEWLADAVDEVVAWVKGHDGEQQAAPAIAPLKGEEPKEEAKEPQAKQQEAAKGDQAAAAAVSAGGASHHVSLLHARTHEQACRARPRSRSIAAHRPCRAQSWFDHLLSFEGGVNYVAPRRDGDQAAAPAAKQEWHTTQQDAAPHGGQPLQYAALFMSQ